jgi:hypothetical protein
MVQNKLFYVGLILFGGTAACAGSHAEQVQDARMAHADETADARADAVDDQAKQREQALDQRYDVAEHAAATSGEAGASDNEKLLGLSKDRAEYQSDAQARLDKLAVRLDAAQQKISVLGAQAPTALSTNLMTARQEHKTLTIELGALRTMASPNWESDKNRIDDRISQLKDRVSKLSDDIDSAKS